MTSAPEPVDVGQVGRLARYPVKSAAGQSLTEAAVDARGLVHDRVWAVYTADGGIASGKTSRRFRRVEGLLQWQGSASTAGSDRLPEVPEMTVAELRSPDGEVHRVDGPAASAALSRALGQPLQLRREGAVPHHDDCGVHVVTTSSLRRLEQLVGSPVDPSRLRANVVLDTAGTGFLEDEWEGAELALGPEVVLRLGAGMPRCVMVDQPQREVAAEAGVLRALGRAHDTELGLQAEVLRPGTVRVGHRARLLRR